LLEPAVAQQRLGFTIRIPDSPVGLETDPAKARQILLNLLANAVKFTESGEIGLALAVQGEEVACRVWDTGVGIAPGDLQQIFEPFWQVQRGTPRRSGGHGSRPHRDATARAASGWRSVRRQRTRNRQHLHLPPASAGEPRRRRNARRRVSP
jgi:hypothetical protein